MVIMHALVRMALRMRLPHQQQGSVERPLPVIRYLNYEPRARGVNANAVRYPHGGGVCACTLILRLVG
jgi:hypothetical protein